MDNKIFREKSIERVSSPEQLNDYIRVPKPGIWIVLAAVIILLVGFIVWGTLAKLETKLSVVAVASDEGVVCYVKQSDISTVKEGQILRIGDHEFTVKSLSEQAYKVEEGALSDYALHIGSLQVDEWVYLVGTDAELTPGVYSAEIVVNSVSPISFIFN